MIIPTTTVSVLRVDEDNPPTDEWGDPVDVPDTVVASKLPATVQPVNSAYFDPGSGQVLTRQLWSVTLRPGAFAFQATDRVKDENTGEVYQVEDVTASPARLMQGVIHLRCTQVG